MLQAFGPSANLTYCRRYARAEGGQRAAQATPLHGGPNVTLGAAGLQAAMTVSGAVNGDIFAAYLTQVLGPTLRPGDVVVLDNLLAPKVAGLAKLVDARWALKAVIAAAADRISKQDAKNWFNHCGYHVH